MYTHLDVLTTHPHRPAPPPKLPRPMGRNNLINMPWTLTIYFNYLNLTQSWSDPIWSLHLTNIIHAAPIYAPQK